MSKTIHFHGTKDQIEKIETVMEEEVRGAQKMSFIEQDPRDIIGRCLTLEEMRGIPPHLIEKLSPKFDRFLKGKTSTMLDAKGNPVTKAEFNWEYALFDAPQREILDLFSNFVRKPKAKE